MRVAPHTEDDVVEVFFALIRDFVDQKNSVFGERVGPLVDTRFHLQAEAPLQAVRRKGVVFEFLGVIVVHEIQRFLIGVGSPLLERSGPYVFAQVFVEPGIGATSRVCRRDCYLARRW